jgi:hypothetical protein
MLEELEDEGILRNAALALGAATALFSIVPTIAPGLFARLFGIPTESGPAGVATIRSIGIRDTVTGVGLASAALHGGKIAPWLLTRLLVDGGDALTVGWAFARGHGNRGLGALGMVALGAAVVDAILWRAAKEAAQQREDLGLDY